MKRYEIQYVDLVDTLGRGQEPPWERFRLAKRCYTLKCARKEWWKWVQHPWEDTPLFRIYDNKKEQVVY